VVEAKVQALFPDCQLPPVPLSPAIKSTHDTKSLSHRAGLHTANTAATVGGITTPGGIRTGGVVLKQKGLPMISSDRGRPGLLSADRVSAITGSPSLRGM